MKHFTVNLRRRISPSVAHARVTTLVAFTLLRGMVAPLAGCVGGNSVVNPCHAWIKAVSEIPGQEFIG